MSYLGTCANLCRLCSTKQFGLRTHWQPRHWHDRHGHDDLHVVAAGIRSLSSPESLRHLEATRSGLHAGVLVAQQPLHRDHAA